MAIAKTIQYIEGGCMNEWLASLYDDGVSLERGEHTQDVIKLDHDIIFNENLSPEPKLIFINVKRHFIRFYLWIFVFYIYYKLSHGGSVVVDRSNDTRAAARFAGRSAICHTHTFCISYTRISIQFASGFPATVECLFELYLGVVVNYAMTSIFVGWSTWGGKSQCRS